MKSDFALKGKLDFDDVKVVAFSSFHNFFFFYYYSVDKEPC